jgi:hypothetical protein
MIDFSDLDQKDLSVASAATKAAAQTFKCMSCLGSGMYRGLRTRQEETKCFACNGKGHHNKPHFEALKAKKDAKQKRQINRMARSQDVKDLLEEQTPGLFRFMAENQDWCGIYADMIAQLHDGKPMTERQHAACEGIMAKTLMRRAEKTAEKKAEAEARSTEVDLAPIHAMFDKARDAGLKKLCYRAGGLVLKPAKAHSANAGGIYVTDKTTDAYLGKVMGNKFMATRECTEVQKQTLAAIAADPVGEAAAYGKETGNCSCCGRTLTDPVSIERGIGPICESKWF